MEKVKKETRRLSELEEEICARIGLNVTVQQDCAFACADRTTAYRPAGRNPHCRQAILIDFCAAM
ncbi:MAG: hypothetical protein ACLT76_02850 [Clostridium fessum]